MKRENYRGEKPVPNDRIVNKGVHDQVGVPVVNCPTRQSLVLSIGSLHWLSSWRWWPSIGGGEDCISHSGGQKWAIWPIFFANLTNYISPDGEFCFCHLVFGVFCPQIHVFWGPITNFRKWGLLIASNPHFRKFVNMMGTLSAEGGRRQLTNFRKWGLLTISNPHFLKFASCHCTSIRVNFSTSEAEVFSSMCLVRRAGHLFFHLTWAKIELFGLY